MSEYDAVDRQLLRLLAGDGRRSYTDLAKDTGLSTSAVHQRVRRLEQRGAIHGYGAQVDPVAVEADIRRVIETAAEAFPGISVEIRRILLARALQPLAGNAPLVQALQRHGSEVFGEDLPTSGTPLYTDVRLYGEAGIPGVIYGAGPRTVLESHAKRSDERVVLEDLRRATKVIARTLCDLLA